ERAYAQHQLEGRMLSLAEQTLVAMPAVQAFGREEDQERSFQIASEHAFRAQMRAVVAGLRFNVGVSLVTGLGTATLLVVGGLLVKAERLSIGDLLVFLSYLASVYAPLEALAYAGSGFASAAAGARRVFEMLDVEQEVRDRPDARPLPARPRSSQSRPGGVVRFEDVTFGYEPGRPVLHGVSFEVAPGRSLALVGASGAGKSTLASLVPRFFDPWRGCVRFDGTDLRDLPLAGWRDQVAVVTQEPFLFPLSVGDNIAYGRPEATREEIVAAARSARADEFIRALPEGYDTVIGERGATLSVGQRQRLSIARALL